MAGGADARAVVAGGHGDIEAGALGEGGGGEAVGGEAPNGVDVEAGTGDDEEAAGGRAPDGWPIGVDDEGDGDGAAGGETPEDAVVEVDEELVAAGGTAAARRRGAAGTGICSISDRGGCCGCNDGEGTCRKGNTSSSNTTCLDVSMRRVEGS